MKKLFNFILVSLFVLSLNVLNSSCAYERIDAGCEGILVNLYGDDKGVGDVSLVTGAQWYNPITKAIYEYPAYVQTVDYPAFTVNAKDGSEFTVDPTISLKMVDGTGPLVFKKYRKELKEVITTTLFNYTRDAFRIQINGFTTDEIVSNREAVEKAIEGQLKEALLKENFTLEQLTSGLQYPKVIVDAVDAKNKSVQDALKVKNELVADSLRARKTIIDAQAEKEANDLKTKALTPQILEQMWIEKWDGKLPMYGSVPTLFKDISK